MSLNERKGHKTATQRKHEAKKVVQDQCCNNLSLAIKKMMAESHMEWSLVW